MGWRFQLNYACTVAYIAIPDSHTAAAVLLLNWHTEAAHAQSPLCLPYEPE